MDKIQKKKINKNKHDNPKKRKKDNNQHKSILKKKFKLNKRLKKTHKHDIDPTKKINLIDLFGLHKNKVQSKHPTGLKFPNSLSIENHKKSSQKFEIYEESSSPIVPKQNNHQNDKNKLTKAFKPQTTQDHKIPLFGKLNDSKFSNVSESAEFVNDERNKSLESLQFDPNNLLRNTEESQVHEFIFDQHSKTKGNHFTHLKKVKDQLKTPTLNIINLLKLKDNQRYFENYNIPQLREFVNHLNKQNRKTNYNHTDSKTLLVNSVFDDDYFTIDFNDYILRVWILLKSHHVQRKEAPIVKFHEVDDYDTVFSQLSEVFNLLLFCQELFKKYLTKTSILMTEFNKKCVSLVIIKLGATLQAGLELDFDTMISMLETQSMTEEFYVDYKRQHEVHALSENSIIEKTSFKEFNQKQLRLRDKYRQNRNEIVKTQKQSRITTRLLYIIMKDVLLALEGDLDLKTPVDLIVMYIDQIFNVERMIDFSNHFFHFKEINQQNEFKRFDHHLLFSSVKANHLSMTSTDTYAGDVRFRYQDLVSMFPFANCRLLREDNCYTVNQYKQRMAGFKLCRVYFLKMTMILLLRFDLKHQSTHKNHHSLIKSVVELAFEKLVSAPVAFFQRLNERNPTEFPSLFWNRVRKHRKGTILKLNLTQRKDDISTILRNEKHKMDFLKFGSQNKVNHQSTRDTSSKGSVLEIREESARFERDGKGERHQSVEYSNVREYGGYGKEEIVKESVLCKGSYLENDCVTISNDDEVDVLNTFDFDDYEEMGGSFQKSLNKDEVDLLRNLLKALFLNCFNEEEDDFCLFGGSQSGANPYKQNLRKLMSNDVEDDMLEMHFWYMFSCNDLIEDKLFY